MRTILVGMLIIVCIILMIGIYIQQPRLFGDTTVVAKPAIMSVTYTPVGNNPVIDLNVYKATQTAIAGQSLQATPIANPVLPTATVASNHIAMSQQSTSKPSRLPQTGSVDSSDIWNNTPILWLIGACSIIGLGLWSQGRRPIR
ncbi:MAG: hypothetical protein EBS29_09850 [Chloroflexia bacterium]|nr:hypothetical protein [Chloroflexia bacterium]